MPAGGGRPISLPVRHELVLAAARCWVVLAAVFYAWDVWRTTRVGLSDGAERPLGWDFINYWSGAVLAWRGEATHVYDWFAFHVFEQGVVGAQLDFFHYSYPPVLLILTAPLALLPYVPALAAWLLASWYAFYRALRLALPKGAWLLALATPAIFVNAIGGQNGAWTAALMGGGLGLLIGGRRWPGPVRPVELQTAIGRADSDCPVGRSPMARRGSGGRDGPPVGRGERARLWRRDLD